MVLQCLNGRFLHVSEYLWKTHGFSDGSVVKNPTANAGDPGDTSLILGLRKIPWKRKWQHIPVLLPGKPCGWRSLVGYSPWGHKELDMTERLSIAHSRYIVSTMPCMYTYKFIPWFPQNLTVCTRALLIA